MALTYDLTNVTLPEDWTTEDPMQGEVINWRYSVIIMPGTMLTGIGELNDKTIPEFYARLNCYERLHGALGRNGDGTEHLTELEDIIKLKGLKTNVFPQESRTKWMSRIVKQNFLDQVSRMTEREVARINSEAGEKLAEELGLR